MAERLTGAKPTLREQNNKLINKKQLLNPDLVPSLPISKKQQVERQDKITSDIKYLGGLEAGQEAQKIKDNVTGPDTRNPLEKTLGLRKNQPFLFDILEMFDRPDNALRAATEWLTEGKNPIEGFAKGFSGEAKVEWSDILNINQEEGLKRAVVDIGMTIFMVSLSTFLMGAPGLMTALVPGAAGLSAKLPKALTTTTTYIEKFSNSVTKATFGMFGVTSRKIGKGLKYFTEKELALVGESGALRKAINDPNVDLADLPKKLRKRLLTIAEDDVEALKSLRNKRLKNIAEIEKATGKPYDPEKNIFKEFDEANITNKINIVERSDNAINKILLKYFPEKHSKLSAMLKKLQGFFEAVGARLTKDPVYAQIDKRYRTIRRDALAVGQAQVDFFRNEVINVVIRAKKGKEMAFRQEFLNLLYPRERREIAFLLGDIDDFKVKGLRIPREVEDKAVDKIFNAVRSLDYRFTQVKMRNILEEKGKGESLGVEFLGDLVGETTMNSTYFYRRGNTFNEFTYTTTPKVLKENSFFKKVENLIDKSLHGATKKSIRSGKKFSNQTAKKIENITTKLNKLELEKLKLIDRNVIATRGEKSAAAKIVDSNNKKQAAIQEKIEDLRVERETLFTNVDFFIGSGLRGGAVVILSDKAQNILRAVKRNYIDTQSDLFRAFLFEKRSNLSSLYSKKSESWRKANNFLQEAAYKDLYTFSPKNPKQSIMEQFDINTFAFSKLLDQEKGIQKPSLFEEFFKQNRKLLELNVDQIRKGKYKKIDLISEISSTPRDKRGDLAKAAALSFDKGAAAELMEEVSKTYAPFKLDTPNMQKIEKLVDGELNQFKDFSPEEVRWAKTLSESSNRVLALRQRSINRWNDLIKELGLEEFDFSQTEGYIKRIVNPEALGDLGKESNKNLATIKGQRVKGVNKLGLQASIYKKSAYLGDINEVVELSGPNGVVNINLFGENTFESVVKQLEFYGEEVSLGARIKLLATGSTSNLVNESEKARFQYNNIEKEYKNNSNLQEFLQKRLDQTIELQSETLEKQIKKKAANDNAIKKKMLSFQSDLNQKISRIDSSINNTFRQRFKNTAQWEELFNRYLKKSGKTFEGVKPKFYKSQDPISKYINNLYENALGKVKAEAEASLFAPVISDFLNEQLKKANLPKDFVINPNQFSLGTFENFIKKEFDNFKKSPLYLGQNYSFDRFRENKIADIMFNRKQNPFFLSYETYGGYRVIDNSVVNSQLKITDFEVPTPSKQLLNDFNNNPNKYNQDLFYSHGVIVRKYMDGDVLLANLNSRYYKPKTPNLDKAFEKIETDLTKELQKASEAKVPLSEVLLKKREDFATGKTVKEFGVIGKRDVKVENVFAYENIKKEWKKPRKGSEAREYYDRILENSKKASEMKIPEYSPKLSEEFYEAKKNLKGLKAKKKSFEEWKAKNPDKVKDTFSPKKVASPETKPPTLEEVGVVETLPDEELFAKGDSWDHYALDDDNYVYDKQEAFIERIKEEYDIDEGSFNLYENIDEFEERLGKELLKTTEADYPKIKEELQDYGFSSDISNKEIDKLKEDWKAIEFFQEDIDSLPVTIGRAKYMESEAYIKDLADYNWNKITEAKGDTFTHEGKTYFDVRKKMGSFVKDLEAKFPKRFQVEWDLASKTNSEYLTITDKTTDESFKVTFSDHFIGSGPFDKMQRWEIGDNFTNITKKEFTNLNTAEKFGGDTFDFGGHILQEPKVFEDLKQNISKRFKVDLGPDKKVAKVSTQQEALDEIKGLEEQLKVAAQKRGKILQEKGASVEKKTTQIKDVRAEIENIDSTVRVSKDLFESAEKKYKRLKKASPEELVEEFWTQKKRGDFLRQTLDDVKFLEKKALEIPPKEVLEKEFKTNSEKTIKDLAAQSPFFANEFNKTVRRMKGVKVKRETFNIQFTKEGQKELVNSTILIDSDLKSLDPFLWKEAFFRTIRTIKNKIYRQYQKFNTELLKFSDWFSTERYKDFLKYGDESLIAPPSNIIGGPVAKFKDFDEFLTKTKNQWKNIEESFKEDTFTKFESLKKEYNKIANLTDRTVDRVNSLKLQIQELSPKTKTKSLGEIKLKELIADIKKQLKDKNIEAIEKADLKGELTFFQETLKKEVQQARPINKLKKRLADFETKLKARNEKASDIKKKMDELTSDIKEKMLSFAKGEAQRRKAIFNNIELEYGIKKKTELQNLIERLKTEEAQARVALTDFKKTKALSEVKEGDIDYPEVKLKEEIRQKKKAFKTTARNTKRLEEGNKIEEELSKAQKQVDKFEPNINEKAAEYQAFKAAKQAKDKQLDESLNIYNEYVRKVLAAEKKAKKTKETFDYTFKQDLRDIQTLQETKEFFKFMRHKSANDLYDIWTKHRKNPKFKHKDMLDYLFASKVEKRTQQAGPKRIESLVKRMKSKEISEQRILKKLESLKKENTDWKIQQEEAARVKVEIEDDLAKAKEEYLKFYKENGQAKEDIQKYLTEVEKRTPAQYLYKMDAFEHQAWQKLYGRDGFLKSPKGRAYRRVDLATLTKTQTNALFLQGFATGKFGSKIDAKFKDTQTLRYLEELSKYAHGGQLYVHKSIADAVIRTSDSQHLHNVASDFLDAMNDGVFNIWKRITLFGAAPAIRSMITNWERVFIELGLAPNTYIKAFAKATKEKDLIKKMVLQLEGDKKFWDGLGRIYKKHNLDNKKWQKASEAFLRKSIIKKGTELGVSSQQATLVYDNFLDYQKAGLFGNALLSEDAIRQTKYLQNIGVALKNNDRGAEFLKKMDGVFSKTLNAYAWTDEVSKIAIYRSIVDNAQSYQKVVDKPWAVITSLDPTLSALQKQKILAGKAANITLFNFTDLSVFERTVLRQYFIFLTWPLKNLQQKIVSFARNNKKWRKMWRLWTSWNENLASIGEQSYNPDRDELPKWAQERGYLALPWKSEDDKGSYIQVSPTLLSAEQFVAGGWLGTIHPVVKGFVQATTGIDLFKKTPLQDPTRVAGPLSNVFAPPIRKLAYGKELIDKVQGGEADRTIEDILLGNLIKTRNIKKAQKRADEARLKRLLELRRKKRAERGFVLDE